MKEYFGRNEGMTLDGFMIPPDNADMTTEQDIVVGALSFVLFRVILIRKANKIAKLKEARVIRV